MKILAVSDIESPGLESLVQRSPGTLKDIGCIISCGDLDRTYIEFLVDGINRELFFVAGNHHLEHRQESTASDVSVDRIWEKARSFATPKVRQVAGRADLHGRVEVFQGYLIAGFGGGDLV